jgi:putative ABC transport system permease protein
MFANILAAALRNLARNRLYAAISIGGLAIGMAAALLTALYVHDELTFDRAVPGHERVFVLFSHLAVEGRGAQDFGTVAAPMAAWLKLDFPHITRIARYTGDAPGVRRGLLDTNDQIAWVDPDFFAIVPMPVVAGDLQGAMRRPDAVVLTRSMARKYFGKDAPLGETLEFAHKTPFRVAAVIEDRPSNANIQGGIFASGLAPTSQLTLADQQPYKQGNYLANFHTYIQLRDPRDAAVLEKAMPAFISRHMAPPAIMANSPMFKGLTLKMIPITAMHLIPDQTAELHPGSMAAIYALSVIALLILVVAGTNFVNLQTARGARRAVEVGVRKAAGAGRGHLVVQFLGESLVYAVIAIVCALALAEAALPGLDALVLRKIPFTYWRDPQMMGLVAALTLALGFAAGVYPALVLSSFGPAAVLKDSLFQTPGSAGVRRGLVVMQFAVLITLLLAVMTIYAQTRFAMNAAIGLDKEQMLTIQTQGCRGAFVDKVRALPGVVRSACSNGLAVGMGDINTTARKPDGQLFFLGVAPIDYGFFEAYGVKPLAGRLPSRSHGGEGLPFDDKSGARFPAAAVVNLSAVHALGFARPDQAVGAVVPTGAGETTFVPVRIIGVVPDIAYNLTTGAVKPTVYPVVQPALGVLSVKLKANAIPATLKAIDKAWMQTAAPYPIRRRFIDEFLNRVYADLISQGWLIGALAGIAAFIACLGLFGLAAFTTEQRTKEIGVRKAMGASTTDVLGLLLWSFIQPVLWANLIAWPLGWWAMDRWLHSFSARISLSPWFFLAAGGAAVVIAALTVSAHALRVARSRPVGALRYE